MKTIDVDEKSLDRALLRVWNARMIPRMKPLGVTNFNTEDVLDWKLGPKVQTIREALIDAASRQVSIPSEYKQTWFGAVGRGFDEYIVTIWPGPAK